jgi:hypothetical protein
LEGLSRKSLTDFEWKAEKPGAFKAVVATYGVIDKDGDVTEPGALDTNGPILVSGWNHSSIDEAKADLPVGSAKITTIGDRAVAEGRFYLDDPMGERAYKITKALFEDRLGQWSYGFRIPPGGATTDPKALNEWPGAVRLLKRVEPFEVSLVFAAAGEGTQTLSVKSVKEQIEEKVGARLSKESRARLRALAADLLAFVGEADEDPNDAPKSRKDDIEDDEIGALPNLAPSERSRSDAELQEFLRSTRDAMERERSTRLIDLRFI